jgi:putative NADPH-quinone reductase
MGRRIVVIQGHPDSRGARFGHALADAYAQAAREAGHQVHRIAVAELEFPWLRTKDDYETGIAPEAIRRCQETLLWAEHLVVVFPLWAGTVPALLKAFFEQMLRPGFAYRLGDRGRMEKLLAGRSARIVVTMGMPAFVYRWYFGAHGIKNLRRGILGFCGIRPIHTDLIGRVEGPAAHRAAWLDRMRVEGRAGH